MQRSTWLAAAVLAGLLMPAGAGAEGTYTVFSCRDPLGAAAPAAGWTALVSGGGGTVDGCLGGGALSAGLPAAPAGNDSAGWRFDAPPNTSIVRLAAARRTTGLKRSTQASDQKYVLDTDTAVLEECAPSASSSCIADLVDPIDKQGLNAAWVRFRTQCTNAGGTCSGPLSVDASALAVGLRDATGPTVANVRVLDDGDRSGTLRVGFDAGDVGGGVYRTRLKVDGRPAAVYPMSDAPCADAAPRDQDPYQFLVPVPCPASVPGGQGAINAQSLPAGPHSVEIAIEDAAGNQVPVYGPMEFPRLNTGTTVGSSTDRFLQARLRMWFVKARRHGQRLTSRVGRRVVTRGVLRDRRGRGIQGARVDVYHIRNGTRRLAKTGLKTRGKGALTLILPSNVDTRTIEFAYRAVRPGPVTSRQRLRLRVVDRNGRTFVRRSRR
jgi:hypothetical protein